VDPLFDENYNLWVMLLQTRDVAWAARTKDLAKYNLAVTEAAVLNFIQIIERTVDRQATIAEISRWLFRKPNSMSELLSRMEKKGLVRRVKDLPKNSAVRIELTEKGKEVYESQIKSSFASELMSSLSEEERLQMWTNLSKLRNKALNILGIDRKPPFPSFP
jgi:DNA-binding MarR family transcriptional regulator